MAALDLPSGSRLYLDANLLIYAVERNVLLAAAKLRATNRIPLADSIHWASAVQSACNVFLTNVQRLKSLPDIRVIVLSEHLTP